MKGPTLIRDVSLFQGGTRRNSFHKPLEGYISKQQSGLSHVENCMNENNGVLKVDSIIDVDFNAVA